MRRSLSVILAFMGISFAFLAEGADAASAHGSGAALGSACDATGVCPDVGGKAVKFHFSFTGTGTGPSVPVSGTFSASEPETGVQVDFTAGSATVSSSFHSLTISGTCTITTPTGGSLPGTCFLSARDNTQNGAVDTISLSAFAANGSLSASGQLASGNINIE